MNSVIEQSIAKELFVKNEYGYSHQREDDPNGPDFSIEEWDFLKKNGMDVNYTYPNGAVVEKHRMCIGCQARHILKYRDHPNAGDNPFQVECKGVPAAFPPGTKNTIKRIATEKNLSEERALQLVQSSLDPVAWAELMFGFSDSSKGNEDEFYLRWYQKEQLRCTAKRMVIREGRRTGKALSLDTPIPTPNGWTTMGDLKEGDIVFDENGKPCNVTFVTEVMHNHEVYEVVFSDGSIIKADAEHQWSVQTKSMRKSNARNKVKKHGFITLTTEQMIPNLKVGNKKESNYSIPVTKPLEYGVQDLPIDPYVLGFWLGDGGNTTSEITIGIEDQIESISNLSNRGFEIEQKSSDPIQFTLYGLITKLKLLNLVNNKHIPRNYLQASISQRMELLNGLMDTDGTIGEDGIAEFCSTDKQLAYDTLELILGLGFKATIKQSESWLYDTRHKDRYRITFNPNKNVFKLSRKAQRVKAKSFIQENRYIVDIRKIDSVPVKCITVDSPNHLYLAGKECIPTHNTFLMALKILNLAFNLKVRKGLDSEGNPVISGPEIIVVAPFSAQLVNFFNEMEKLLKRNLDLCKEITTEHAGSLYVKTPFFRMGFSNGAAISGFVTGVEIREDGSSAGALRGQSAHIIYLDEMDMIQPDVLDKVILPILLTSPHTIFYATSTPIGKAGAFYGLCFDRPDFVETYLPSTVLPHWETAKKDLEYKDPKDDAFVSEYMAQFIESTTSVFKSDLIISAMKNYDYSQSDYDNAIWWNNFAGVRNRSDLMKCIGIDWNKNAGSEFVVVCYNPKTHNWWIAEAVNISPTQHNSIRFKEEVKRLNAKWKPDWIYADEGYGHHIIDDLLWEADGLLGAKHLNAIQQQTVFLKDRLKKFNFSQKVELKNPVDGTLFTRTGKEFLVENTIRVFEEGRIGFPASDNTLRIQMQNYIVLRRHQSTGRPVYGMRSEKIGDHRLDAMMLALAGLFLENNPVYSLNSPMSGEPSALIKGGPNRSREEEGGHSLGVVGGLTVKELKYLRGSIKEEPEVEKAILANTSNETDIVKSIPVGRSEFPTSQNKKKSASILEDLWQKKLSETNTIPSRTKPTPVSNDFYVVRKGRKNVRGFR